MSRAIEPILSRCQLFADVDDERRGLLAGIARTREFPKGQSIFRQGDECPGVYVVDAGMVRIFKMAPSGKEHILHMVGPGGTFAEAATIGEFPCPAHAEATIRTTCVLIPMAPLRRLLATDHGLCLQMMTGMSGRLRQLTSLMEDIVLRDAVSRVARFLVKEARGETRVIRLPGLKRHVANHLNLTSETFSRVFGRLTDAGVIVEMDGSQVELREPERLRRIAEGQFPEL